jgi:biopolymer transport protein TolQ
VQEEISILGLILEASFVVQLVMFALLLASVMSWYLIFQRSSFFKHASAHQQGFEDMFWSGMDLTKLYKRCASSSNSSGLELIFKAGFKEFNRLKQQSGVEADAVMEGTQRSMRVALSREGERLDSNLPFLATVGSTSPYIGLFGTVWGIMNSFLGLAQQQQATLATVAPGIAEALIATAMGLFAAIPAVVAYNRFSARADALYNSYETFADEFSSILHRNVHSSSSSAKQDSAASDNR